jgi:hypothetical protein
VELPRTPVGVNVPDASISILVFKEVALIVEILTLISTLWPLLIVSSEGEAETEKGN